MQQEVQLFALLRELEARPAPQIERFVRVACPVIGTSLAGGSSTSGSRCWCWPRSPTRCAAATAAA